MKRFFRTFSLILALFIAVSSFSAYAEGSYITLNGFTFRINGGEAVIYSYDNRSSNLVIPQKIMGAKVTEIANHAFFGTTELLSVDFSKASNLRKIGSGAFNGCTGLKTIDISESVTELGFGTFQNCSNLEKVDLSGDLASIPEQCFFGCGKLNGVVLPDTASSIEAYAFGNCAALDDITIPKSVTSIATTAFSGCGSLRIFGYRDSAAISFAQDNNIDYIVIDEYRAGDANLDGDVNILDVTFIQKCGIGIKEITSVFQREIADVNHDGSVSVRDATLIQMYLAGIISDTDF